VKTAADAIIPPAPKVHAKDLTTLRLIVEFTRNTVSTMPNCAFDVMISRRRVIGLNTRAAPLASTHPVHPEADGQQNAL
jgi:hypothetical protein